MDLQNLISELVGAAYPIAVALEGDRLRRNWIARTAAPLPSRDDLKAVQRTLEDEAYTNIKEAHAEVDPIVRTTGALR